MDDFSRICLTSQGRGKIQQKKRSVSFSYESILKGKSWDLALFFPGKGEEIIHFRRGERVSLESSIKGIEEFKQEFMAPMESVLEFIELSQKKKLKCSLAHNGLFFNGECEVKGEKLKVEGKKGAQFKLYWQKYSFLGDFLKNHFKKLEITVGSQTPYQPADYKLELYVDQCLKS